MGLQASCGRRPVAALVGGLAQRATRPTPTAHAPHRLYRAGGGFAHRQPRQAWGWAAAPRTYSRSAPPRPKPLLQPLLQSASERLTVLAVAVGPVSVVGAGLGPGGAAATAGEGEGEGEGEGFGIEVEGEGEETASEPPEYQPLDPGLYLVGTPIGNLEDITVRALRVLRMADTVLAEDTRRTGMLLNHYGIKTRLKSYHTHNEAARRAPLISRMQAGESMALVSDAGMPGVSDPGTDLVVAAAEAGVTVVPIPGPSAVLAGVVASGLPTDSFLFGGFLPKAAGARRKRLELLSRGEWTLVLYVPPHGLLPVLRDAEAVLGASRRCVVARELTKRYEEFWRSSVGEAVAEFTERDPRGEITLLLEGAESDAEASEGDLRTRLVELMRDGVRPSEASKIVAEELSAKRKVAYRLALELSKNEP